MRKLVDRVFSRWVPWLGYWVIRGIRATMRIRFVNADAIRAAWKEDHNLIAAFWHGHQLMMPFAYGGKRMTILISRHRDGEWIARAVRRFGFHAVRGSTTRGGSAALKRLVRSARAGDDLAVTPDGPRGPKHVAQPGVVQLAKLSGLPIYPVAFGASKKKFFSPGTAF
jgi:lysophospholipid acyltransferase (LPLAT)-like uncharacterized protein